MTVDTATALQLTRIVKTDPQTAFDMWTRPEHIRRWSCPEGHTVIDSQVELEIGGKYLLQMRSDDGLTHTAVGVFRVIDPPRRVAYTWDWVEDDHRMDTETLVTVEFRPAAGGTELVMTHEGLPGEEMVAAHREGWESCLGKYEQLFDGAVASGAGS